MESASSKLKDVLARIRGCQRCPVAGRCKGPVPGSGPVGADIMVVGQAPGREEDREHIPWVGQAGQFLSALLETVGFPAHRVYFTNVAKCFPGRRAGGDNKPSLQALEACRPHLQREIETVQPKLIISVGDVAMKSFGIGGGIKKNSGRIHDTEFGPVMTILHPAGLMRRPADTPQFATSLHAIHTFLSGAVPPPSFQEYDEFARGELNATGV